MSTNMLSNIFRVAYTCLLVLTFIHGAILPLAEEQIDFKEPIVNSTLPTPTLGTTKMTRNVTWKLTINDHNFDLDVNRARSSTEGVNVVALKESKDVNNIHPNSFSEEAVTTVGNGSPLGHSETQEPKSTTSNMMESSTVSSDSITFIKASDSSNLILSDSDNDMIIVTEQSDSAQNTTSKMIEFSKSDSERENESETTTFVKFLEYTKLSEFDSSYGQINGKSEESENTFIDEIREFIVDLNKTFNFQSELDDEDATTETSRIEATTDPIPSTHLHTVATEVKHIGTEFPVNAELTESINSLSEVFSTKAREISSVELDTTSMGTSNHDFVTFESSENDHDSNFIEFTFATPTSTFSNELVDSNVKFENTAVIKTEIELVTASADSVTSRPDCPPPGMCVFWFMAQDTCAVDSHCLGSRICCKIRCSKTCMDV